MTTLEDEILEKKKTSDNVECEMKGKYRNI